MFLCVNAPMLFPVQTVRAVGVHAGHRGAVPGPAERLP